MCGLYLDDEVWAAVTAGTAPELPDTQPPKDAVVEQQPPADDSPDEEPSKETAEAIPPEAASAAVTSPLSSPIEEDQPPTIEMLARPAAHPAEPSDSEPSLQLFPDEKRPPWLALAAILLAAVMICVGVVAYFAPAAVPVVWVLSPTAQATSEILPSPTTTPSPSATLTATPEISPTPTITPTPLPTNTPQPPRTHTIESGQTLVGLALLYDLTLDSIFNLNNFNNETLVFAGQEVLIPWPTATPPLQAIAVEIGEATLIVDPSVCPPFYEIQEGDSLFFIAVQNDVPLDALLELNFLTLDDVVRPGDVICVPNVIEGGFLPPTPGPSPTPTPTAAPTGPQLLYPASGETATAENGIIGLQWLAVKPLTEQEWYMIEVLDLTDPTQPPRRGFTRANSFQMPADWGPTDGREHRYSWRVSIIQVTGQRSDGGFIYTFGGAASPEREFIWRP
ncbi:MAG: LysM peptidoglycan-binding domain-containing protein [Ardenticatenaceae bacterium]|nr:LysM peptidoglycan-binding domain-containing protein [Ardenticatenaceae bacterium]